MRWDVEYTDFSGAWWEGLTLDGQEPVNVVHE
jgi:hypothetical protein